MPALPAPTDARSGAAPVWRRARLEWLPAAVALVYAVVMVWRLPAVLGQIYRFGDAPAIPLMARAWHAGGGTMLVPTQTSITAVAYDVLISPSAHFTGLAMVFGPAVTLLAALLMWRAAQHATGRAGALVTLALAIALPPVVIWADYAQDNHVITVLMTAVLAWHVTTLRRRAGRRALGVAAAAGVAAGVAAVDDPQSLVSAVLPFVAAVALLGWADIRSRRAVLLAGVVTLAVTVAVSLLLPVAMTAAGIEVVPAFAPHLSAAGVLRGLDLGARGLVWMEGGLWYGSSIGPAALIPIATVVLTLALPVVVLVRDVNRRAMAASPERAAHAVYWIVSGCAIAAAFLYAGDSFVPGQAHYVIGVFYAAAALVAHLAGDAGVWLRRVATVAATAVSLAALLGMITLPVESYAGVVAKADDATLAARLQAHGLRHGYADYWDAYDVTWLSGARLDVWPVNSGHDCAGQTGICPYGTNSVTGAYRGSAPTTFVIVRSGGPGCVHAQPPVGVFGPPADEVHSGELVAYVYPYDVATRFTRAVAPLCTG